jgi:hypothetical protein
VTIWNDHHWFSETFSKLAGLGCTLVSTYAPLFWRFPDRFLQLLLLNEPPHRVYEDAHSVLQAEHIWADEDSLHAYRANIRWRALGDASELPGRPEKNTYFPDDLFHLEETDSFLDCGAFDGDTIRELLVCTNSAIQAIHAVEAMQYPSAVCRSLSIDLKSISVIELACTIALSALTVDLSILNPTGRWSPVQQRAVRWLNF